MSAAALRALAGEIRRLQWHDHKGHLFYERRREIAARLEELSLPPPCTSCSAPRLTFDLDCAQRKLSIAQRRYEDARERLALAETLLRQAVRGARRRRSREAPPLLPLWGAT